MYMLYLICAVIGGTVMVCQFVLTLMGMADVDDFSGDVADDLPSSSDGTDGAEHHHGSTWLFGVVTFRTIVTALAFFGLAGLAGSSATWEPLPTLVVAIVAGLAAMYGVHWLMQAISRLKAEGTARIQHAMGRHGTVYLRVPPQRTGAGKVTVNLRDRTMEYQAVTAADELPTGARVIVTGIIGHDTVEVAQAPNGAEE